MSTGGRVTGCLLARAAEGSGQHTTTSTPPVLQRTLPRPALRSVIAWRHSYINRHVPGTLFLAWHRSPVVFYHRELVWQFRATFLNLLQRLPYSRALTPIRNTPKTQTTETLPSCIFTLNTVDEDTVRLQSPKLHRAKWTDLVAVPQWTVLNI